MIPCGILFLTSILNNCFPLVDYCIATGDLVKTIVDDKIQWEFELENEKDLDRKLKSRVETRTN